MLLEPGLAPSSHRDVGNLVCPAIFELGEQAKVASLSVTEATTSRWNIRIFSALRSS